MANGNSTDATLQQLIQSANDYCLEMGKFLELAEREIEFQACTSLDGMEYLVKAAKSDMLKFANLVYEIEHGAESEVQAQSSI